MNKPTVPEVRALLADYRATYPERASKRLHVILDDGNIQDVFILYALVDSIDEGDVLGEPVLRAMLKLSKTQRGKLVGA